MSQFVAFNHVNYNIIIKGEFLEELPFEEAANARPPFDRAHASRDPISSDVRVNEVPVLDLGVFVIDGTIYGFSEEDNCLWHALTFFEIVPVSSF